MGFTIIFSFWPTSIKEAAGDLAIFSKNSDPLLVGQNLCHAAALNFTIPPHDTNDDLNTRRAGRIVKAPTELQALTDSRSPPNM